MTELKTLSTFSDVCPTHVLDGLFVPTKGVKPQDITSDGKQLRPSMHKIRRDTPDNEGFIGFQGIEILGAEDQSVFLSIVALGRRKGQKIPHESAKGKRNYQRLFEEDSKMDTNRVYVEFEVRLTEIARHAGFKSPHSQTADIRKCLDRLGNVSLTCRRKEPLVDEKGRPILGVDGIQKVETVSFKTPLIIAEFMEDWEEGKRVSILLNPHQAEVITRLDKQYVRICLVERYRLSTEIEKLLHFWLCANTKPGAEHGVSGSGVGIDTLVEHVWGESSSFDEKYNKKLRAELAKLKGIANTEDNRKKIILKYQNRLSNRRRLLKEALDGLRTKIGWKVESADGRIYHITRPKKLAGTEDKQLAADEITQRLAA